MTGPAIELRSVIKGYGALRPLRIDRLTINRGEQFAIVGLDRPAAEILINLVTGATLPDSGDLNIFGRASQAIRSGDEWLALVDRFGIVSERAVLLEGLSVLQNLAVPFSLEIEPPPEAIRDRAAALARETGLDQSDWDRSVAQLTGSSRLRLRLARGLALDPDVVLLEHPTAGVDSSDVVALARSIRSVVQRRGAASLTLTADRTFAAGVASRVLTLDPATGRLTEARRHWWPF